jgi:leucyl aminopeptidase
LALFSASLTPSISSPFFSFSNSLNILQGGGCGSHFFDITESHAAPLRITRSAAYPSSLSFGANVRRLFPELSWPNIKANLEQYSTFHTRFSETQTGAQAAQWLLAQIQDVVKKSNKAGVTVSAFPHAAWPQNSVVARVQGKSNRTVVVGAHLDSINSANRMNGRAPGVDDDGSGSLLLVEALRVLLTDDAFAASSSGSSLLENTVEFHWYAAEEGGLRGSQDIFTQYKNADRDVWAMLQQDMVGYTKGTLNAGKEESFGLITDFTDGVLNEFLVRVIGEVSFSHPLFSSAL